MGLVQKAKQMKSSRVKSESSDTKSDPAPIIDVSRRMREQNTKESRTETKATTDEVSNICYNHNLLQSLYIYYSSLFVQRIL